MKAVFGGSGLGGIFLAGDWLVGLLSTDWLVGLCLWSLGRGAGGMWDQRRWGRAVKPPLAVLASYWPEGLSGITSAHWLGGLALATGYHCAGCRGRAGQCYLGWVMLVTVNYGLIIGDQRTYRQHRV